MNPDDFWKSINTSSTRTLPFRRVFSALWHYSSLPVSSTNSSPISRKTRSSSLQQHADHDSHRLAVQYAMNCASTFDHVTKKDLILFVERFGEIDGSPPICVCRARASLLQPIASNASNDSSQQESFELVRWYHGDVSRTEAQQMLTETASQGGTTRYLIRGSRKTSHLVLSMASHPAFSTEGTKRNWKIICSKDGFSIGGSTNSTCIFSDLNKLLASRGMVAPFFQPCTSSLWSITDPEHAANTCLLRMPLHSPLNALETQYLSSTPAIDDVQLCAGISAFNWDIDEAVVLFEDVYRRNRSAIDLREILSCARSLGNLGNAQQKKGKGEVAVRYFEECLQLLRQLLIGRVAGETNTININEEDIGNQRNQASIIKLDDLIRKEANIVANLCVVTSHILQVTPGEVSTDERKAQIAVQFCSCLGEELGIAGNCVSTDGSNDVVREKMKKRHEMLLESTGIELSWVSGLPGKLLEDAYQMIEEGKVLSASHCFFQSFCISRLTSQPALEALALESLADIPDIPIVIFLRIWSTFGKEYWSSGISSEGKFVTKSNLTFCCIRAAGSNLDTNHSNHRRLVTQSIMRATSPVKTDFKRVSPPVIP